MQLPAAQRNILGFTLIELLVAISIIAVLSAIGAVTYGSTQRIGRISKRVQDLKAISNAIELYKVATGKYPIKLTFGCVSTVSGLTPTYMQVIPLDPLDSVNSPATNCYQYRSSDDGTEYKVRTNTALYDVSKCPVSGTPSGEMCSADFKQQPGLVDPANDGGTADCNVEMGGIVKGWAIYSSNGICPVVSLPTCTVANACGY